MDAETFKPAPLPAVPPEMFGDSAPVATDDQTVEAPASRRLDPSLATGRWQDRGESWAPSARLSFSGNGEGENEAEADEIPWSEAVR